MEIIPTSILATLCLLAIVLSIRAAQQPVQLGKARLFPHHAIQIAMACVLLLLLAHLVTLLTGTPLIGRAGY